MENLFRKTTLFSISGILIIILGIPFGLYVLTLNGGRSLGGVAILFAVSITAIVLLIDRLLVTKINRKKLSHYELVIAILLLIITYLNN